MSAILKSSAVATGLENVFSLQSQRNPVPKNVQTVGLLHSFFMLARLCSKSFKQSFSSMWTKNFLQTEFRWGRGTRNQIAKICWIMEKAREFQKIIYFSFIDYTKAFDCVDHNKLWKILKEMRIPDHMTCLLRNLYADQRTTHRTGHGTRDWLQISKGVHQAWI